MRAVFQLDAFGAQRFAGNPAAVVLLDCFPDDIIMQAIVAENNLAETVFWVPESGDYRLRWFTPTLEVPLCGHAMLAIAAVLMGRLEPGRDSMTFRAPSGPLIVGQTGAGYIMNFPVRHSEPVSVPPGFAEALGVVPIEVYANTFNCTALLERAQIVSMLTPGLAVIAGMDRSGVIVMAPSDGAYDFVSCYFAPSKKYSGRSCHRWRARHVGTLLGCAA